MILLHIFENLTFDNHKKGNRDQLKRNVATRDKKAHLHEGKRREQWVEAVSIAYLHQLHASANESERFPVLFSGLLRLKEPDNEQVNRQIDIWPHPLVLMVRASVRSSFNQEKCPERYVDSKESQTFCTHKLLLGHQPELCKNAQILPHG